jgi:hypothetical protein
MRSCILYTGGYYINIHTILIPVGSHRQCPGNNQG